MGQTYVRMYACRRRWVERFVQASKRGSFAVGSVPPTLTGMHVCCPGHPGHVTGCHGMLFVVGHTSILFYMPTNVSDIFTSCLRNRVPGGLLHTRQLSPLSHSL